MEKREKKFLYVAWKKVMAAQENIVFFVKIWQDLKSNFALKAKGYNAYKTQSTLFLSLLAFLFTHGGF